MPATRPKYLVVLEASEDTSSAVIDRVLEMIKTDMNNFAGRLAFLTNNQTQITPYYMQYHSASREYTNGWRTPDAFIPMQRSIDSPRHYRCAPYEERSELAADACIAFAGVGAHLKPTISGRTESSYKDSPSKQYQSFLDISEDGSDSPHDGVLENSQPMTELTGHVAQPEPSRRNDDMVPSQGVQDLVEEQVILNATQNDDSHECHPTDASVTTDAAR